MPAVEMRLTAVAKCVVWTAAAGAALALPLHAWPRSAAQADGQALLQAEPLPHNDPLGIVVRAAPVPGDAPRFQVAAIRRNVSGVVPSVAQGTQVAVRGNRVIAPNITVRELIRAAYNHQHLPRAFVTGGPDWIDGEHYDVDAVATEPFGPIEIGNVMPPDASAMLRALLADRFGLALHNEIREDRIYELILDRDDGTLGPELKPSTAECRGPFQPVDREAQQPTCPFILSPGPAGPGLIMSNFRMRDLAMFLSLFPDVDAPVADRTGLTGRYDTHVRYQRGFAFSATGAPVPLQVDETEIPTITRAIREQLGLRLERTRGPIEVLVVDRVERPSEN
jgi:uncharacterized protein (TIGR03435 family)